MDPVQTAQTISKADGALVGSIIDERFRLDDIIGAGGMSVVYRATHILMHKPVAVKVLRSRMEGHQTNLARFQREIETTSALDHPNIVQTFAAGVLEDGRPYLALELLQGRSLADHIAAEGKVSWTDALPIFVQIAQGLDCAHQHGIVHRDIKPSNVMLVQDDMTVRAKLLDFGIAGLLTAPADDDQKLTTTAAGVPGSPPYMSPECCLGQKADARSDIYSLGCLMYQMLCGHAPFNGENPLDVMFKHAHEKLPALPNDARVPGRLRQVVYQTLEKDPGKRQQTVAALLSQLEQFNCSNTRKHVFELPPLQFRKSRQAVMIVSAIAFALILVGSFLLKYEVTPECLVAEVVPLLGAAQIEALGDRCLKNGYATAAASLYLKAYKKLNDNDLQSEEAFAVYLKYADALFASGDEVSAREQYADLYKKAVVQLTAMHSFDDPSQALRKQLGARVLSIFPRMEKSQRCRDGDETWLMNLISAARAAEDYNRRKALPLAMEVARETDVGTYKVRRNYCGDSHLHLARCYRSYVASNRYAHQKAYAEIVKAIEGYKLPNVIARAQSDLQALFGETAGEAALLGDRKNYDYWVDVGEHWTDQHQVTPTAHAQFWEGVSEQAHYISPQEAVRMGGKATLECKKILSNDQLSTGDRDTITHALARIEYRCGAAWLNLDNCSMAEPFLLDAIQREPIPSSISVLSKVTLARAMLSQHQIQRARRYFYDAQRDASTLPKQERLQLDLKPVALSLGEKI